jgi:hypothetical protein
VPTDLVARHRSGAGEKNARVYNLSTVGAFLETSRPSMPGGHATVHLPFPNGAIDVVARIVSTNVPGNLIKENLPTGMGIEFVEPDAETQAAIDRFVADRILSYEL